MSIAIVVIVSLLFLIAIINTVLLLLLGSVLVQLVEKSKIKPPVQEVEKPWYADI